MIRWLARFRIAFRRALCDYSGHKETGVQMQWPPVPGRCIIWARCSRCGEDCSINMPDHFVVLPMPHRGSGR